MGKFDNDQWFTVNRHYKELQNYIDTVTRSHDLKVLPGGPKKSKYQISIVYNGTTKPKDIYKQGFIAVKAIIMPGDDTCDFKILQNFYSNLGIHPQNARDYGKQEHGKVEHLNDKSVVKFYNEKYLIDGLQEVDSLIISQYKFRKRGLQGNRMSRTEHLFSSIF